MKRWCIAAVTLVMFDGCSPIVGGPCKYDEVRGTAKVLSVSRGECIVDFEPERNVWPEWNIGPDMHHIDAVCIGALSVGERYPALFRKETEGSCVPYEVTVCHPEIIRRHKRFSEKCGREK